MAEAPREAALYKGKAYPIEAWRIIYDYITSRKAPDAEFYRLTARYVTRDEALELYRAQMWRPWEITFIKIAPPEEEWVSDEAITGYDIYYNRETKKYIIREPKTKNFLREEDKICLELTASIKTSGGHDKPVVVEITCTTYVKEKGLADLTKTESNVNSSLVDWLVGEAWGNLLHAIEKTGVSYNGENLIKERAWYAWQVPDYPKVHVLVEKKKPRERSYEGEYKIEE